MKRLLFYGYSDDNFCEETTRTEIDNCASGNPIQCLIASSEGQMFVTGQYSRNNNGCWDIGIGQVEEDKPILNWKMKFEAIGYSMQLEIEVPNDAKLKWFKNMIPTEE